MKQLLAQGLDPGEARAAITDQIDEVLERWSQP
jgi:hypothetical protein